MIKAGIMAAGIVLAASTDWELQLPDERVCAKSQTVCEAAMDAIRAGRWPIVPPETPMICRPSPGCIPEAEDVIRGFNDR